MASNDNPSENPLSHLDMIFEPAVLVKTCREASDKPWTLHLTNLDQLFNYNNSVALFYGPNPAKDSVNVASVLKKALQELLVHYPWAAGRLRVNRQGRLEVDCSAQGVQFVIATAQHCLADLGDVSSVNPALDPLYASIKTPLHEFERLPLVALQVTRFSCGGFVLSITSNHVLFDGCGACTFLRNLCSLARSAGLCIPPDDVDRTLRIKPRNPPAPIYDHPHVGIKSDASYSPADAFSIGIARKFTFSEETLQSLRLRVCSQNGGAKCSRFVALAAHMWIAMAKTLKGLAPAQDLPLRVPVNLRGKYGHGIPSSYMGNAICGAEARAAVKDLRVKPLAFAASKIQEAVVKMTADYLQSEIDLIEVLGRDACMRRPLLTIPSLASLPFYDTDCGWGMPMYMGRPSKQFSNRIIVLAGDAEGQSLNVLVALNSDEELSRFEDAINVWR